MDRSYAFALLIPSTSFVVSRSSMRAIGVMAKAASAAFSRVCSTRSLVSNNVWMNLISTVAIGSETGRGSVLSSFPKSDFSASKIALCTFLLPVSEKALAVKTKARHRLEQRSVTSQNVGHGPRHSPESAQTFICLSKWVDRSK